MEETSFVDGLIVKKPREGAPEFVIGSLSMKREELIGWLGKQEGEWVNADMLVSKKGSWYAKVNTWKPEPQNQEVDERADEPEDMPF